MMRTALAILLASVASLTSPLASADDLSSPLASADDLSSLVRGGRLYDNWSLESQGHPQDLPNPAFKTKQVRVAAGDTWRCVECHGWDYQGNHGITGLRDRQHTDPAAVVTFLKTNANHHFEELLHENELVDLANFITSGQVDMKALVEAAQKIPLGHGSSEKIFATICANCHGFDGGAMRRIPPLGDSARERPYKVLHVAFNGHPSGDMPALRTLGDDTVVSMLAFLQTLPSVNRVASIANGGRLYDDWQANSGERRQALPHPAYPANGYYVGAAPETWRCKTCHGWDYKGNQGQYASGNLATGIKGIRALAGADPERIMGILRSSTHLFGAVLQYRDLQDLANFVSSGQIDMDSIIDPVNGRSRGDAARGAPHYRSMCAGCHGPEGRFVAKRDLGRVSRTDPWHSLHNMYNGHPDDAMPALREIDAEVVSDILAHMQSLQGRR